MDPISQPIHTLEARDNVMLEVVRDGLMLTDREVRNEIQRVRRGTEIILTKKGIAYQALKSGLVPSIDRHEAGFLFDRQRIESGSYGTYVSRILLPLLDPRTTQSVLCGDLLRLEEDAIFKIVRETFIPSSTSDELGCWLYCVYINNLSDAALLKLHSELGKTPSYVGYIPATFASRAKTYLSFTLVNSFLKHSTFVIMGHEEDRSDEEDVNMAGAPFEEFGYRIRSLQSTYFDLFLSYKIERAVHPEFQTDTEMALRAVSDAVVPLADCKVILEEAKHGYLLSEKLGVLQTAGIADLSQHALADLIKTKVDASYIYNLQYLEEHNVTKFNVMVELPRSDGGYPARLVAALEYRPEEKILRLITLY